MFFFSEKIHISIPSYTFHKDLISDSNDIKPKRDSLTENFFMVIYHLMGVMKFFKKDQFESFYPYIEDFFLA